MRICSLLPSATEIVSDLGLGGSLVGRSDECKWPEAVAALPVVTAARIDLRELSSVEIDRAVRAQIADGRSLYAVDSDLLDSLRPDVIVTQDLCAVCAVSSGELATACPVDARVISLDPRTLDDVAGTVLQLGDELHAREAAAEVMAEMRLKIAAVEEMVAGRRRPRVFVAEWIDPPFCPGHWIPEMVECAGGECVLGEAGEPSHPVTWEDVRAARPDLVVVAPCGFDAEEAAERAAGLDLPVRTVAVDGDAYFSRPAPRLADGVRQLGHLLHPAAVPDPGLPAIELLPAV